MVQKYNLPNNANTPKSEKFWTRNLPLRIKVFRNARFITVLRALQPMKFLNQGYHQVWSFFTKDQLVEFHSTSHHVWIGTNYFRPFNLYALMMRHAEVIELRKSKLKHGNCFWMLPSVSGSWKYGNYDTCLLTWKNTLLNLYTQIDTKIAWNVFVARNANNAPNINQLFIAWPVRNGQRMDQSWIKRCQLFDTYWT